jgi:small subunit ribosomal protein S9
MVSKKAVVTVGKKKSAVARASISKGKGAVRVNSTPVESWGSYISRNMVMEPVIIAGKLSKSIDIAVNVQGGGAMGQAVAARVAIARALVKYSGDEGLRKELMEYDDKMLAGDSRVKETRKPNRSRARARRQKSYR